MKIVRQPVATVAVHDDVRELANQAGFEAIATFSDKPLISAPSRRIKAASFSETCDPGDV